MQDPPLRPGEVRFQQTLPSSAYPKRRHHAQHHSDIWPGALVFAAVGILAGLINVWSTSVGIAPSPPTTTAHVPAAPLPPAYYGVFVSHAVDKDSHEVVVAVAFLYERLEIIPVPPNVIPKQDQDQAIHIRKDWSGLDYLALQHPVSKLQAGTKLVVASSFVQNQTAQEAEELTIPASDPLDSLDERRRSILAETAALHSGLSASPTKEPTDLRPYILHGNIDIICGQLGGNDAGFSNLILSNENLSHASIYFAQNGIRGPPAKLRKIYVTGKVEKFIGPAQLGRSVMRSNILDLTKKPYSWTDFQSNYRLWEIQLASYEKTIGVAPGSLHDHEGDVVDIRNHELVSKMYIDGVTPPPEFPTQVPDSWDKVRHKDGSGVEDSTRVPLVRVPEPKVQYHPLPGVPRPEMAQ